MPGNLPDVRNVYVFRTPENEKKINKFLTPTKNFKRNTGIIIGLVIVTGIFLPHISFPIYNTSELHYLVDVQVTPTQNIAIQLPKHFTPSYLQDYGFESPYTVAVLSQSKVESYIVSYDIYTIDHNQEGTPRYYKNYIKFHFNSTGTPCYSQSFHFHPQISYEDSSYNVTADGTLVIMSHIENQEIQTSIPIHIQFTPKVLRRVYPLVIPLILEIIILVTYIKKKKTPSGIIESPPLIVPN